MNSPVNTFDVIGLGASTVDILSLVDVFPNGEGVQKARHITAQSGGPVATAMATVATLGGKAAMLDVVSDDWCGNLIRSDFDLCGVSTEYLKIVIGHQSACASVLVRSSDGARAIAYTPGTVPPLQPADIADTVINRTRILHVNGRHWEACMLACQVARTKGVLVSFDGGAHRYAAHINQLMPLVDICIVAHDFATSYSGSSEPADAAAQILACGPRLVVITNGIAGSDVFTQEEHSFWQPSFHMPTVVDTTGCGDSYHGAFLFALTRGWTLRDAAMLASAVAALNTQKLGGRAALPTLDQAITFLGERGVSIKPPTADSSASSPHTDRGM